MPRFLIPLLSLVASAASALTFTTHFPLTRGTVAYAVSPSSSSVVYAVQAGILYRSSDGGTTFETRSTVGGANVVVDPTDAEIVYDVGGLRRSNDGGATWKRFGDGGHGGKIVIHPANPAEIRLLSGCSSSHPELAGVFVSYDRGDSWRQETSECTFDVAFDPLWPYTEYRGGVFGSGGSLPARQVVADAGAPRVRYGLSSFERNVILFSDDWGRTWRKLGLNGLTGDSVNVLALDGARARLFAGTSSALYAIVDDLPWWQPVPAAPPGPVLGLTIAGDLLYVATANGCYRAPLATLDPFTPVAALPLLPAAVRGLAADPHAPRLYATAVVADAAGTQLGNVWRSDDGGAHWQPIDGGGWVPLTRGAIVVDGAGDVYAFDYTPVGGTNPVHVFHYDPASGKREQFSTDLELDMERVWADPHRRGVLYTIKNSRLYRSGDGGHSWQLVSSFNDGTKWIFAQWMTFGAAGVIFVATDAGLYRTLDDGVTWSALDALDTSPVEAAPSRPATLYRFTASGLSRSDDSGATWTQLPLPSAPAAFRVDPLNENSVWIADAASQLFHSVDGGARWTLEAQLPAPIATIAIDSDGTHLHVALAPGATPGEWDATIRGGRQRAARIGSRP